MSNSDKVIASIVDLTPKWSDVLPWYIGCIHTGNERQRQLAIEEITRLGVMVDKLTAEHKH